MYRPIKGLLTDPHGARVEPRHRARRSVIALDAASGRTLWEHTYDAPLLPRMNLEYGTGPHATPLVVGDTRVRRRHHRPHARARQEDGARPLGPRPLGRAQGNACRAAATRAARWPTANTVIVTVGGPGQALVAFDQKTGAIAWKNGDVDPSPSSPRLIRVDGQEQLVLFHADGVAGFDPARARRSGTTRTGPTTASTSACRRGATTT